MPIIVIYGIPLDKNQGELELFVDLMRCRAADVPELGITMEQVSVFLPRDLLSKGLGEEIIIFVEGLLEQPERTEEVRKRLASNLVDQARALFPDTNLVECLIRSVMPNQIICYEKKELWEGRLEQDRYVKSFR